MLTAVSGSVLSSPAGVLTNSISRWIEKEPVMSTENSSPQFIMGLRNCMQFFCAFASSSVFAVPIQDSGFDAMCSTFFSKAAK